MITPRPISKFTASRPKVHPWQIERAKKLHRACLRVEEAMARGEQMGLAARHVARNFNGRRFIKHPTKRMQLCAGSLVRLFKIWKRSGQIPQAFYITYRPRRSNIPVPALVRFAEFCAITRHESMKDAWQTFCVRPASFGRGRHAGKSPKISLGQIYYHFPAAIFYRMQSQLKTIASAQTDLGALRLKAIADIRAHLPDRVPLPDFQI